jgi:ATP-dependent RNA helicase DeaD
MDSLKHYSAEYKVITVYGGVPIQQQVSDLHRGVDFFVGTTGRVLDHIQRGNIDFSNLKCLVLDEADQMLKMGFKEDIDKVSLKL